MEQVLVSRSKLTAIADAIRQVTGSTDKFTPSQMAEAISTIEVGDPLLESIVDGTVVTLESDKLTKVRSYLLRDCKNLTTVNLPAVTEVGAYAFQGCELLSAVCMPTAETVGPYAFNFCTGLNSIDLPMVTELELGVFSRCTSLADVSAPNATSIGDDAFSGCTSLTNICLPSIVGGGLNYDALYGSSLTEIHFAAANQASIRADSGYATLWGRGAGNATVYFDL